MIKLQLGGGCKRKMLCVTPPGQTIFRPTSFLIILSGNILEPHHKDACYITATIEIGKKNTKICISIGTKYIGPGPQLLNSVGGMVRTSLPGSYFPVTY